MVLLPPDAFLAELSRVFSACQKGSVFITIKAQGVRKVLLLHVSTAAFSRASAGL
jgi:hypothetical protein